MPSCFALTKKGERKPTLLTEVDTELCSAFGIPLNPDKWLGYDQFGEGGDWYNYIGLGLAMGNSFMELDERYAKYDGPHAAFIRQCLTYLRLNYTSDAWHERR